MEKFLKREKTEGFRVDSRLIVTNSENKRQFGPCPSLFHEGFGFMKPRPDKDKSALISYARDPDPTLRIEYVGLVLQHEERVVGLARSILRRGMIQPLVVRLLSKEQTEALGLDTKKQYYDLIDGATRLAAIEYLRCLALMPVEERKNLGDMTEEELALVGPVYAWCQLRDEDDTNAGKTSHDANFWSLGTRTRGMEVRMLREERNAYLLLHPEASQAEISKHLQELTGIDHQTVLGRLKLGDHLTEDDLQLLDSGALTLGAAMEKAVGKGNGNGGGNGAGGEGEDDKPAGKSDTKVKVTVAGLKADYLSEPRKTDDPLLGWLRKKKHTERFADLRKDETVREFMSYLLQTAYKPLGEARKAAALPEEPKDEPVRKGKKRRTKAQIAADGEIQGGKARATRGRKPKATPPVPDTVPDTASSPVPDTVPDTATPPVPDTAPVS